MSALGTNRLLSATSRSYYVSTSMVPPRAETVKPINAMFPQFGDVTRIWPLYVPPVWGCDPHLAPLEGLLQCTP
jgi:hypothetical protein